MTIYKPYDPDQPYLLPPILQEWLPESHLANFIHEMVGELDLGAIHKKYSKRKRDGRGQKPFDPGMMVRLLFYAYCTGKPSSRKIEKASYEEIPYRVLTANQHPDHDTIAAFRRENLQELADLFSQVLRLCQAVGLVKLGHVALDGTKVKANASKHKAMSYGRMSEAEQQLEQEVAELLKKAEAADQAEDRHYGKGKSEESLPKELTRRQQRLEKIRQAKYALEQEAKEQARQAAAEAEAKIARRRRQEDETGQKAKGREPQVPDAEQVVPEAKAQRNFTDPESRIMKDGASKSFEQAYNAQAVVDAHRQVIVAAEVTDQPNDKQQLVPMLEKAAANLGSPPEKASADTGYFSEAAVTDERLKDIDLYVATRRQKHGEPELPETGPGATVKQQMEQKLRTAAGRDVYKMRKAIVEPVFGQIKEVRGFRRFSFRGREKVRAEWRLICLTHNVLKLYRDKVSAPRCAAA